MTLSPDDIHTAKVACITVARAWTTQGLYTQALTMLKCARHLGPLSPEQEKVAREVEKKAREHGWRDPDVPLHEQAA